MQGNKTQPMSLKDFFKNMSSNFKNSAFVPRTQSLPNDTGTYQTPTPNMSYANPSQNMSYANPGQVTPPVVNKETPPPVDKPTVTPPPIFKGSVTPGPTPGSSTTPSNLDYSRYTNPATGQPYTVKEYADVIAQRATAGAIPNYAGDAITKGPQTAEELTRKARELNINRNDIATGEKDPYKIASESGLQYSPAELAAIEKAYAGIYDPAIQDVFTKLEIKQKADEKEKTRLDNIEKAELESKNRLKEMAQQHKYDIELKKTPSGDSTGGFGEGGTGEFGATVDLVANMEPSVYGKKSVAAQLRGLIDSKDYASAYGTIANSIENQLVGESKQKYVNARTDYGVMTKMREAIQKYADDGGDMNLLVGTEEEIKRKLGIDSGKASELATYLWREFQTYRNNMTGAAFGAAESRDYSSVNPSLKKELNLNLSVIDGARNQLKNRVIETIDQRVPSAKYIREYAEGAIPGQAKTEAPKYTVGQVISVGGKNYKITGLSDPNDPDVEPI